VALVYLGYNLLAAALSLPLGRLSDRVGRRPLLLAGYLLYALAYGAAAFSPTRAGAVVAFTLLAMHTALVDGQARSLIADLVPRERRATAYGAYHAAVGAALLPASLLAASCGSAWARQHRSRSGRRWDSRRRCCSRSSCPCSRARNRVLPERRSEFERIRTHRRRAAAR
jgi:MFS family permease